MKALEGKAIDFDPFRQHGELERTAPSTEGQTEIWTSIAMSPEANLAYSESLHISVPSLLDPTRLKAALALLIKTHDALRMSFSPQGLTLFIAKEAKTPIEFYDLRTMNKEQKEEALARLKREATTHPFDLQKAPLIRLVSIAFGENETRLLLTAHHLITDGWSLAVLLKDLTFAYNQDALPKSPSFADYAEGEKYRQQNELAKKAQNYWKSVYSTPVPNLELPIEGQRPPIRTFEGNRADTHLPLELVATLKQIARENKASYVAAQLTCFAIFLYRLSGERDLVIGMPSAGQAKAGLTRMVGHAVHLLPLRVKLKEEESFLSLLNRVKTLLLDAHDHQDFTFGELLKTLSIKRDASRIPLVSVMFNVDTKLESKEICFAGVASDYESNPRYYENFELFLNITDAKSHATLECQYNTSLFSHERVLGFLNSYKVLLNEITSRPEVNYSEFHLAEIETFAAWNATQRDYPKEKTLVELLREVTHIYPQRLALESGKVKLSYQDLWIQSAALRDELIAAGINTKSRVGICLQRSEKMILAQLAILRAGASYVPLDPSFPAERLHYMISDAALDLIVAERATAKIMPKEIKALIWEQRQAAPASKDLCLDSKNPAYMIYTSGSTGLPKGVVIEHQSVVNFLLSMRERLAFQDSYRFLALTTLSFDIAVLEIFMPLISGSTVVLASNEERKDAFLLKELIEQKSVDIVQATPSTYRMLLSLGWKAASNLTILCGGEAFPADLREDLKSAQEIWNLYGPTEATVWITAKRISELRADEATNVGRPIGNTRLYILDEQGKLLPPLVKGEVYIAGDNLAKGYWQRPELDAEKFVFPLGPEVRLYRTGDIGRFTKAGELEVLGRIDAQVKIRGYRIELGEIENRILEFPPVRAAAVTLYETDDRTPAIAAYLCWNKPSDIRALQEHLRVFLPDYMLPQHYLVLESLPLLPNGKLNRQALPLPHTVKSTTIEPQVFSPSAWQDDPSKAWIAALWQKTLSLQEIRAEDDFFLLGGHSLLAIQVLAKVNQNFGTKLTLKDIFLHPSFLKFAEHVLSFQSQGHDAIPKAKGKALSFAQERMWYVEQLGAGPVHNLPGAWLLKGNFEPEIWQKAIGILTLEHETLREGVTLVNGVPVRKTLSEDALSCPLIDLSEENSPLDKAMETLRQDAKISFDLETDPLIRFKLFKLSSDSYLFSILVHHMIWDGYSFDLFFKHMHELYQKVRQDKDLRPRTLRPNYADFSEWQRSRVEHKGESYRYWTKVYSTLPEPLDIPLDRPRPTVFEGSGKSLRVDMETKVHRLLESRAKAFGATPFILSMSALVLTLHRLSGQTDIVIGTPLRGRTRSELEELLGVFINVMPLRFTVNPEDSYAALIAMVKKVCLEGFDQQEFPFESLLETIKPPRDESRTPFYTAMFSYQDISERIADFADFTSEQVFLETQGVPTDLVFWMKRGHDSSEFGIDYRDHLWEEASIRSFSEIYQEALLILESKPNQRLNSLGLFPAVQANALQTFAQVSKLQTSESTLTKALAKALVYYRQSLIRSAHESYSYESLEAKANAVAIALHKLGVKAGDRVGLATDRSIELLEGLLGIVLSGAAYVPMDPNMPKERLRIMAEQAELKAIVTQEDWLDILPLSEDKTLVISEIAPTSERANARVNPEDPAYVIFTSGSTGVPKAVQISQRAAIHFLESMQSQLQLRESDIALALTTVTFDISVLEIFGSILQGARLVLAESAYAADGEALARLIDEENVSFMQMTPSGYRILLESAWQGSPSIRAISGGEPLAKDLLEKLLPKLGKLWNAYGPTEATVWASLEEIKSSKEAITIGRPLPGYEALILQNEQLAPIGVWGELHLGGPSLADGYLKDEEKTKSRFFASSHSRYGRLYATGDIARFRSDGRIEFKARSDSQVKIRGYRIELEEIEAIALKDSRIRAAAAKVFEAKAGDQRLVLYFCSSDQLTWKDLQSTYRTHLPKYMWPAIVCQLDSLPLTSNGKLNRLALPKPDFSLPTPERKTIREPKTYSEREIAKIWQELLGVQSVGLDDNFFELGGHSLLTLKMLSRINENFSSELKLRDVLTANLAQLATLVSSGVNP